MKTALTVLSLSILGTFASGCAVRDAKMWTDDTGKALAAKNNDIKACYDGFLQGQPGAGGKVTVSFDVDPDAGKVQNVKVDKANTTAPDAVGDCVKKSIEGVVVSPVDSRGGNGSWVYEFSQPPAPKS